MQPTLCSKCKKNVAVVFISRQNEKGEMVNEGLCLKCAAQLGLPQVEEMMKRMGITPEDLENINSEMMQAFGGAEEMSDLPEDGGEDDEESGKTATFPFLNRLFGGSNPPAEKSDAPSGREEAPKGRKADKKHKYLDSYCINLSQRARDGKLDAVIGREEEIQRVVQILNRRQKNNPCLIGEPGVGKTAIAEGLAQRIAAGDVPFKLRDKQVYLLDLTALVAGTQFRGQFESRMKGLIEEIRKLSADKETLAGLLAQTKKVISGSKEGYDAELALLREKHTETEERIKRLVESLSVASDTSAKYVMEQIDELHQQSEQEQSRLSELEALTEQSRMLHQEFAFHQEMIESFASAVDSATLEEKRRLLRTIVKKVVWDGKNAYVYLFAEDGEADLPPIDQPMYPLGEDSE